MSVTYGYGDGDVDTNLTGLDLALELASRRTGAGEDGCAVTVLVCVDHLDSLVDGLDVQADKHRAEDLFSVALHVGLHVGDDGRSDPVTVGVVARRGLLITAVKENGGTLLLSAGDQVLNALLGLGADDRTKIGVLLKATVHLQGLRALGNLRNPVLGLADQNESAESHASLTSGTEGSTSNRVQSLVLVAVGKDSGVVLSTKVGLDTLAIGRSARVDVLSGLVGANEADGLDAGLVDDKVDRLSRTVDDVDNTGREAGLLGKLSEDHARTGVALRGLDDNCVTSNGGDGDGPERNHSREVWSIVSTTLLSSQIGTH